MWDFNKKSKEMNEQTKRKQTHANKEQIARGASGDGTGGKGEEGKYSQ